MSINQRSWKGCRGCASSNQYSSTSRVVVSCSSIGWKDYLRSIETIRSDVIVDQVEILTNRNGVCSMSWLQYKKSERKEGVKFRHRGFKSKGA